MRLFQHMLAPTICGTALLFHSGSIDKHFARLISDGRYHSYLLKCSTTLARIEMHLGLRLDLNTSPA
jgi:hypothetical protein